MQFVAFYNVVKLLCLVMLFFSLMLYPQTKILLSTATGHSLFLVFPLLSSELSRQNQRAKVHCAK